MFIALQQKIFWVFFLILGGVVLSPISPVFAVETDITTVLVDAETLTKQGKTIQSPQGEVTLGLPPGALSLGAVLEIIPTTVEGKVYATNFRPVSGVYDIRIGDSQTPEPSKPAWLRMIFSSETSLRKRPYLWDESTQTWGEIPARFDASQKSLTFGLRKKSAIVTIFEDTLVDEAPVQNILFAAPVLQSPMAIVVDQRTQKVLYEKNADQVWWPASLTKLATAMVFLDTKPDMNRSIMYAQTDSAIGSKLRVRPGETLRVKDAFETMLVGSANNATKMLVRNSGLTEQEFLSRMNQKAQSLGMAQTVFADPTGLSEDSKTTARDMSRLMANAARYFEIFQSTNRRVYNFSTLNTKKPHRIPAAVNEKLAAKIVVQKTGYIDEAKYLYGAHVIHSPGNEYSVVVLGAPTKSARMKDAQNLISWVNQSWKWDSSVSSSSVSW